MQSALGLESISFMREHHLGHTGSGCIPIIKNSVYPICKNKQTFL